MKSLGGVAGAERAPGEVNAEAADNGDTSEKPPAAPQKYNPMASLIERHENAVNRLRGKVTR